MSTAHDPMKAPISLHGLGFIQVQLQGDMRLHVWHPDLPRRRCFEHSAIHDHRFDFESLVLIGTQINIEYEAVEDKHAAGPLTHLLYLHEGRRTPNGGRPWVANSEVVMTEVDRTAIPAGESYRIRAYNFHRTEPGGNGKVATIMQKLCEYPDGATSSCTIGIEPDTDFDRFQLSPAQLWTYVLDVLGAPGQHVGSPAHQAPQLPVAYTTSKLLKIAQLMPQTGSLKAQCKPDGEWRVPLFTEPQQAPDLTTSIAQAELALLGKVEQMAAYYEGPKGFFDWIDQQKAMRTGSPEGLNLPQQGAEQ